MPDDLDFALRTCAQQGKHIRRWREKQWRKLESYASSMVGVQEAMRKKQGIAAKKVANKVRLDRIDIMRYSMLWPDVHLWQLWAEGADIAGPLPRFGVFRDAEIRAGQSLDDLLSDAPVWNESITRMRPPEPEQAAAVWKKSEEERQSGILDGWYSATDMDQRFGRGSWRALVRFGRYQFTAKKWRQIDNGKSSGHNATLDANERIHTTSNSASLSLIQRMRHHWGPFTPETAPKAGTHDMARAFRQIPVADAHLGLSVVAAWDPGTRGWRFGVASPTKALQSSMCSNNSCFCFCLLIC